MLESFARAARRCPLHVLLALVLLAPAAAAQQPAGPPGGMAGQIAGTIVDAESGDPLALATVALYLRGEFVTGAATGPAGAFEVGPLRPGTYEVRISSIGYASQRIDEVQVRPGSPVAMGTIRLAPETALLGEAEVVAERELVEVRADRTVYNVSDQPVTAGGNALDVLETLPALDVDIDGRISLRGNQNVAVHINGRPVPIRGDQLAAFLRNLPSDQVERVEVLPNPSARFEADSMAGIINIVLRQGTSRGLSGGLSLGGGTSPSANASGNVAYQQGPLDLFASYGLRYDDRYSDGATFRDTPAAPRRFLDQTSESDRTSLSHTFNTSVDYRLRPGLNVNARGLISARTGSTDNVTRYRFFGEIDQEDLQFMRMTDGDIRGFNGDLGIGLKRTWTPQTHELSFEARGNLNASEDNDRYTQTRPDGGAPILQRTTLTDDTGEASLQADYVRPLGSGRVEIGGRTSFRRMTNDLVGASTDPETGAVVPDPNRTNVFDYDEDVYASYLQGSQGFGDFELQLGVRAEHTATAFNLATTGETFGRSYTDFFPSAFLAYSPWTGGTVRGGYSRRINRPRARQLNPFTSFDDPLNVRRGNPDLQPEYVDAFEVAASQFLPFGTVSLTPFFRRTTNVIRPRFIYDPATNVTTFTQQNLDSDESYGADLTLAARIGQALSGFVSTSVYRTVTSAGNVQSGLQADAVAWTVRGNLTTRLAPNLTAQLFGFYRSPMETIDGRISSFSITNIGLRQSLMNERASISLRASDPLNMGRFEFTSTTPDFSQTGFRNWGRQRVDLTFTYNFGQMTQQQRRRRGQEQMPEMPQDEFGF
jgi:outer membrane receptor protein involved in Fe transport